MVYMLAKKQLAKVGGSESCIVNSSNYPLPTTRHSHSLKAFTLVELSIVIVIMGLLVAATMAGRELLSTSKLRAVIGEIEVYKVAVDGFKIQYESLPGDLPSTKAFWTTAQNGGVAVGYGNNDGKLGVNSSDYTEPYYLWNHLTLSKLVPGTFSGSSATYATIGTNVPASKYLQGLGFSIAYYPSGPWGYVDSLGRAVIGNHLILAMQSTQAANYPSTSAFTPGDAQYIDSKIDDGTPDFGKVLGGVGVSSPGCTSGSGTSFVYDTTLAAIGCMLFISIENK